jgi:hypothetical protein
LKKHTNSFVEISATSCFDVIVSVARLTASPYTPVSHRLAATVWPISRLDPDFEMLWIKVVQNSDVTFVYALYPGAVQAIRLGRPWPTQIYFWPTLAVGLPKVIVHII